MRYVSTCLALCSENSNEIDGESFTYFVDGNPRKDDNLQTVETCDISVDCSCNSNVCTNQNKIIQT